MVILADYKKKFYDDDDALWGVYSSMFTRYEEYAPEDMPALCVDLLEGKDREIFVSRLDLYYKDIIRSLWLAGFSVVQGNPAIKKMKEKTFKYLISGQGVCYHITVKNHGKKYIFLNISTITSIKKKETFLKSWGSEDSCKSYTMACFVALSAVLEDTTQKSRPLTIGAAAKKSWYRVQGYKDIRLLLKDCNALMVDGKKLTYERFLRKSYHGGLNIFDHKKEVHSVKGGIVVDCNSFYPYVMKRYPLPFGYGKTFFGEPDAKMVRDADDGFSLFFVSFRAIFTLKDDGIPCIRVDNCTESLRYETDWLTTSDYYDRAKKTYKENRKGIVLTLTSVDYKLFIENYDFTILEWGLGIWFPASLHIFDKYIDYWYTKKETAKKIGSRRIAKMFLNNLSGKMAVFPEVTNTVIKIDGQGDISEEQIKTECTSQSFVHVGAFITSYARAILISVIKKNRDRWLYSDSDSLHLIGDSMPVGVTIGNGLGEWKIEKRFDSAYYYDKKQYITEKDGKLCITMAGLTDFGVDFIREAYKAKGDYFKFKYYESVTSAEYDAICDIFDHTGDEASGEIIQHMLKRDFQGERLVEGFAKDGLKALPYCDIVDYKRCKENEPFNVKYKKSVQFL